MFIGAMPALCDLRCEPAAKSSGSKNGTQQATGGCKLEKIELPPILTDRMESPRNQPRNADGERRTEPVRLQTIPRIIT
jgi:hypothetical protein